MITNIQQKPQYNNDNQHPTKPKNNNDNQRKTKPQYNNYTREINMADCMVVNNLN
jgi:hypothetical protein